MKYVCTPNVVPTLGKCVYWREVVHFEDLSQSNDLGDITHPAGKNHNLTIRNPMGKARARPQREAKRMEISQSEAVLGKLKFALVPQVGQIVEKFYFFF